MCNTKLQVEAKLCADEEEGGKASSFHYHHIFFPVGNELLLRASGTLSVTQKLAVSHYYVAIWYI